MKVKAFLIIICSFYIGIIYGQPSVPKKLPDDIHSNFTHRFPSAYNIDWDVRHRDNKIEAEFNYEGRKYYTRYDSLGKVLETQKEITYAELPRLVVKSLHQEYAHYKIGEIYYIKLPQKIVYEVVVENNKLSYILHIYPYGRVYRKNELAQNTL